MKPFKSAEIRGAIEVALVRHTLEREVREREHWFSTTLRSVGDAVIAVGPDGVVRLINGVAEGLLGVSESEVVGRSIEDVVQLADETSREPIENPVTRALERRRVGMLPENTLLANAPREQPIEDSCAPIVDETGRLLGAVMVFRDIAEKRRSQQRVAQNDRLASVGTLVAGVAHELSNPLTAVFGNAELLSIELDGLAAHSTKPVSERCVRAKACAESIVESAQLMSAVISDLRLFVSPQPDITAPMHLREAVELALRRTESQLRQRARVVVELEADAVVLGDPRRLAQVFINLLTNAAHAIAPGDVEENEILVRLDISADNLARVCVRDTGCGIAPDMVQRVFDPFFTTKPLGQGSGLGLAISHGIVRSLHGDIHVVSELGQGTLFVVSLPLAQVASNP